MAEFEPGNPDELQKLLVSWLNEAQSSTGSLPDKLTPTEWAVRQFIESWRKPVRDGLDSAEVSLRQSLVALQNGDVAKAVAGIESALQTLGEDVRADLGLTEWHVEGETM